MGMVVLRGLRPGRPSRPGRGRRRASRTRAGWVVLAGTATGADGAGPSCVSDLMQCQVIVVWTVPVGTREAAVAATCEHRAADPLDFPGRVGRGDRRGAGASAGASPRRSWPPGPTWWCAGARRWPTADLPDGVGRRRRARGRPSSSPADVRDADQAAAVVAAAVERFGRLDVLVNNAGGSPVGRRRHRVAAVLGVDRGHSTCSPPSTAPRRPTPSCRPRRTAGRSSTSPRSAGCGPRRAPPPTARPRPG